VAKLIVGKKRNKKNVERNRFFTFGSARRGIHSSGGRERGEVVRRNGVHHSHKSIVLVHPGGRTKGTSFEARRQSAKTLARRKEEEGV